MKYIEVKNQEKMVVKMADNLMICPHCNTNMIGIGMTCAYECLSCGHTDFNEIDEKRSRRYAKRVPKQETLKEYDDVSMDSYEALENMNYVR